MLYEVITAAVEEGDPIAATAPRRVERGTVVPEEVAPEGGEEVEVVGTGRHRFGMVLTEVMGAPTDGWS